jgi:hypothetical protein
MEVTGSEWRMVSHQREVAINIGLHKAVQEVEAYIMQDVVIMKIDSLYAQKN